MFDVVIENALHKTMISKTVFDVASQSMSCVQFNWSEVLDVFRIEEHPPHSGLLLVNFQRVASENDALKDDSKGIWGQHCSRGHNVHVDWLIGLLCEADHFARRVDDGAEGTCYDALIFPKEPHEFELVSLA